MVVMIIDQNRIRTIIQEKHSYYIGRETIRVDARWVPPWDILIASQLTHPMDVLDVGCGNGHFLLEHCQHFRSGLGIDNDDEFLEKAEKAKHKQGALNVAFQHLDFPQDYAHLQPESFDMLVSFRGPLPDTIEGFQAAHYLLRPDGLLFCEEIAEHHQKEVNETFFPSKLEKENNRKVEEVQTRMENNGFEARLTADVFTKWIYQDIYAWVAYISNLWTWLGIPMLDPGDPRIAQFAERNSNAAGEIVTTHHVAWVAGIKN